MEHLFLSKSEFNISMYEENVANRWKFLERMDPTAGREIGLFLQSPVPLISLTSMYLLFVYLIGPWFMRNRQPYEFKTIIRFYNLLEVILPVSAIYLAYDAVGPLQNLFDCSKTFTFDDGSSSKIYQMGNFFLMSRMSEYLDTIFFVLRKKQSQVTFLHVFHHCYVPIWLYWTLRTAPTRFNAFIILLNSSVHIPMYLYYFLATFQQPKQQPSEKIGGNVRSGMKQQPGQLSLIMQIVMKLLMLKKYITKLQIAQFILLAMYIIQAALRKDRCGVPWITLISFLGGALGFLYLFLRFYVQAYARSSSGFIRTKRE